MNKSTSQDYINEEFPPMEEGLTVGEYKEYYFDIGRTRVAKAAKSDGTLAIVLDVEPLGYGTTARAVIPYQDDDPKFEGTAIERRDEDYEKHDEPTMRRGVEAMITDIKNSGMEEALKTKFELLKALSEFLPKEEFGYNEHKLKSPSKEDLN